MEPTSDVDCCEGEAAFGDPRGLHSIDCPEYIRLCANLSRAIRCSGDVALFNPAPCGRAEHHPAHDIGIPPREVPS